MNQDVTITVSGPQGVGKSLIAEAISIDLHARGFNHVQVDEEVVDRATPEEAPRVVIHAVRGDRPPITTSQLGLPAKSTGVNAYIDSEIEDAQRTFGTLQGGEVMVITTEMAGQIARGAALHVIADKETLIKNLETQGYRVLSRGRALYRDDTYPSGDQINTDAESVHQANVLAGWWSDAATGQRKERNVGELLMLVTSEVAEADEGRADNLRDDKLPHRYMLEVELADTKIRILDMGGGLSLNLGAAFDELVAMDHGRLTCAHLSTQGCLMAIVGEVAKAMEGDRKKAKDKVLTQRSAMEARLAAALVLIHYLGHRLGLDVDAAVTEKRAFNLHRADHKLEARKAAGGKAY